MKCEDVELELTGAEPSPEARAHLEGCRACQDTARLLGLATLPPPSQAERLVLSGVATSTQRAWNQSQRRFSTLRRVASLALAAGVGALVASTAVVKLTPVPEARIETRVVTMAPIELPSLDVSDEPNLSDDEVFFDVGWPSPTEGDQQ